jgi:hypothetical protein
MRVGAASYRAHENEMTGAPQFIDPHHNMWADGPQCVLVFEFSRCKRPVSANRKIESIYGHAAPLRGRPSKSSRGERYSSGRCTICVSYNLCVTNPFKVRRTARLLQGRVPSRGPASSQAFGRGIGAHRAAR